MKKQIRVMLIDDHQMVLRGLKSWLEEDNDIAVVGVYHQAREALQAMEDLVPDVVVCDVRMPEMNGMELARKVVQINNNRIKVVLVSGFYTTEYHVTALEIGVSAFLPKDSSYSEFINIIKQSYFGYKMIPSHLEQKMEMRLTPKETDILKGIAAGETNEEISKRLHMSRRTVEHHISSIFRKLDVDGRVGAVIKGIQHGILGDVM
ncbi:response regulator [Bacillus alkalicellulosilyticus]|uniref:response regulator transcription factor n=1 Tax=Alkalihalobacterium alkalicellulosilyticum TaxID=1912214 RepID=UPI000997493D|nr:response regulator transcription factor [Bacillus alkalicellulosilyticus]